MKKTTWPYNKKFAFTIVDDTDEGTTEKCVPIYNFLYDNRYLTTKTVWPLSPIGARISGGESLEDVPYRQFILNLQHRGFEIALHGVADESSTRERVIKGFNFFNQVLGHYPNIHVNHFGQKDCLYWGHKRFNGLIKFFYSLKQKRTYCGDENNSKYFWGDICKKHIKYVRNFTFYDINTLNMDPFMPYCDDKKPYVNNWFSSSDGSGTSRLTSLLSEKNQDRLCEEGGACIVYTHFGTIDLNTRLKELLTRLAGQAGWFVPATTLLDHIGSQHTVRPLGKTAISTLQIKWLLSQLAIKTKKRWSH
jgi:hypothetical protein